MVTGLVVVVHSNGTQITGIQHVRSSCVGHVKGLVYQLEV